MSTKLNRREFLKLLPLVSVPVVRSVWPRFVSDTKSALPIKGAPNILILVFDTLSANHVSLYGYNRGTTPNLARFADKATVYHSHYAAGNFTSSGTASLLTGTYPWSHRAFHLYGTVDSNYIERSIFNLIPAYYHKIAYTHNLLVTSLLHQFRGSLDLWKETGELCLSERDFSDKLFPDDYNVAFQGESTFLVGESLPGSLYYSWLFRALQLNTERTLLEEYDQLFPRGIPTQHSLFFILEQAIDWIQEQISIGPMPFLAYFHLLPPHAPYNTRHDFIDVFRDSWKPTPKPPHFFSEGFSDQHLRQSRREYDEYIAYIDSEFGRLISFMERHGLLENTYVVLTSDHGELFERGILGHASPTLFEPLIRVPMLISKPGQQRRRDVQAVTSCIDLLPTLLQITGQPIPDWCEGKILPTFLKQNASADRAVFAVEAKSNHKHSPLTTATVAMVKNRYKLVHYFGYDGYEDKTELFDVWNDPEETEDLYSSGHRAARELYRELTETLSSVNQPYLIKNDTP